MASPRSKPRVFVDANVLLAGSAFPRWPFEVMEHAADGDFTLVLCPLVIKQAREHLQVLFPAHLHRFEKFLREVECEIEPDPTPGKVEDNRNLVRDLSDVPIALAAMNAKVDFLVSEDKDLTVKDETTIELRRHLHVMLSGTFLREVMGRTSEELEAVRHRKWSEMEEGVKEPD
ncbi:MAG: PIN domain-containing protein [Chloroflexi bacterium]|nr:PIN domain-containing protein [Chloroflexota bacterium]